MLVAIEETDNPVIKVIQVEKKRINKTPQKPEYPIIVGKRKYIITPKIVKTLGVNTPPKVPNLFACFVLTEHLSFFMLHSFYDNFSNLKTRKSPCRFTRFGMMIIYFVFLDVLFYSSIVE